MLQKTDIFKHKVLKLVTSLTLSFVLLLVIFTSSDTTQAMTTPKRLIPIYSVERNDKKIAITFDAAWGADKTADIIAILNENKIKATFFLVSFWAEKYTSEVASLVQNGMEIGTHSETHPHFNKMTETQISQEILGSAEKIEKITQTKVELFRAPFGEYNNLSISICNENKISPIQWSVDSLDWKGISATEICSRIEKQVKAGSIILCHNNSDHIVEAIKTLIPKLIKQGYEFVKVGELIHKENYFIDGTGKQFEKGIH